MGDVSGKADDVGRKADEMGRKADDSTWVDTAARFGLVVYGVMHLVVGWLALQLALGDREEEASSSGALQQLAEQPFGKVVLWAIAVGMVLLVLWCVLDVLTGYRDEDGFDLWRHRAGDAGKAVVYAALAGSAFKIATGSSSGSSSEKKSDGWTARLMDLPAGTWLVGAAGLAVIGLGGYLIWRGLSEKHAKELAGEGRTGEAGRAYVLLGKIGHVAKGLAFGVVGGLFVYAAVTHDPDKSGGLDQALLKVLEQPFGPWLLGAMALGIGCFGLFCFARARHLSR